MIQVPLCSNSYFISSSYHLNLSNIYKCSMKTKYIDLNILN